MTNANANTTEAATTAATALTLSLAQVFPAIFGNAAPQYVVMATLDNVDRVDLEIAKMCNRRASRVGTVAERTRLVEALRATPDSPRDALGAGDERLGRRWNSRSISEGLYHRRAPAPTSA
jgi:hypothetical protein